MTDKIFADTNIIVDLLLDRNPFSLPASKLFRMAEENRIELFVSAGSYDTLYYVLRKNDVSHRDCILYFKKINKVVRMIPVDAQVVENAIESDFTDLEDAVQFYCAKKIKNLKIFITRDKKGFSKGRLTVLSAEEYLKTLN